MATPPLEMKNASLQMAIVAAPTPGVAPTFPTLASVLCIATEFTVSTEVRKTEVMVGCGEVIKSFSNPNGTATLRGIVPVTNSGNGWTFQASGGGTPEGMAIRISTHPKAGTASVYEGIITNWRGSMNADSATVEEITIDLITDWT